jgi:hypothetical protein
MHASNSVKCNVDSAISFVTTDLYLQCVHKHQDQGAEENSK